MNLKHLNIKNFFSYKESSILFSKDGVYTISGNNLQTGQSNGSGKSTIKEAMEYALFNKCRLQSIDDAIHFGEKKMGVRIAFSLDKDMYSIQRIREKGKKTSVTILKNTEDISLPNLKENDALIEKILGINYEKFMHSFCFGQSEFDDLKNLTPAKLIDFLKNALDLNRFDNYLGLVKEIQTKNETKLNKLLGMKEACSKVIVNVDEKKSKAELKDLELRLNNYKNELDKREKDNDGILSILNSKSSSYSIATNIINDINKKLDFINDHEMCPLCKTKLKDGTVSVTLCKKLQANEKIKKDLAKEVAPLKEKKNKFISEIKPKIRDRIYEIQEEISEIKEKLNQSKNSINLKEVEEDYEKTSKRRGVLSKATDIFNSKGLPLYVLNLYLPRLENKINEILGELTDFKVFLKTQKTLKATKELRNTCEIILLKGEREYSLENLSNGEEFLVTLAIRIGVSWFYNVNRRFETLIIDDELGNLDSVNRELVLTFISKLVKYFKKVIIISCIDEIENLDTENKIFVEKSNDVSIVKEEINGR